MNDIAPTPITITNLTQHNPTPDQILAGVGAPDPAVKKLLTFDELPCMSDLKERAASVAEYACAGGIAMIGGAPYFMAPLVAALKARDVTPLFSFTERVSSESMVDGKVIKTSEFKHIGFVHA